MAVAGNSAPIEGGLKPAVSYFFKLTGLTANAKNTVVLSGFNPDFVVHGALVVPLGGAAVTASYDDTTLAQLTDKTTVTIDLWLSANCTKVNVEVF